MGEETALITVNVFTAGVGTYRAVLTISDPYEEYVFNRSEFYCHRSSREDVALAVALVGIERAWVTRNDFYVIDESSDPEVLRELSRLARLKRDSVDEFEDEVVRVCGAIDENYNLDSWRVFNYFVCRRRDKCKRKYL